MMTVAQLQDKLAQNPRSPLFARLADELLRTKRVHEALGVCGDGFQFYPNYITAHVIAAKIFAQRSEFRTALEHLDFALRAYPANPLLLVHKKDWTQKAAEALGDLADRVSSAEPIAPKGQSSAAPETTAPSNVDDVPIVSVTLAEIYASQGAYEAAIAMYRKLQKQKPKEAAVFRGKIKELQEKIRQRT